MPTAESPENKTIVPRILARVALILFDLRVTTSKLQLLQVIFMKESIGRSSNEKYCGYMWPSQLVELYVYVYTLRRLQFYIILFSTYIVRVHSIWLANVHIATC